jgi:uncharacterized membrane protein YukC
MRESLVNTLKPSDDLDWRNERTRAILSTTWTVVKWVTVGFLTISVWAIWLIVSIAFSEVGERGVE